MLQNSIEIGQELIAFMDIQSHRQTDRGQSERHTDTQKHWYIYAEENDISQKTKFLDQVERNSKSYLFLRFWLQFDIQNDSGLLMSLKTYSGIYELYWNPLHFMLPTGVALFSVLQ